MKEGLRSGILVTMVGRSAIDVKSILRCVIAQIKVLSESLRGFYILFKFSSAPGGIILGGVYY